MDRDELLNRMSDDVKQYADNVMDMYNAPFARMMGCLLYTSPSPRDA